VRSGEAALTINVVDVNDERPNFELPVYIFDVEENQSPGTEVGIVSAADRELSPFNQFTLTWRSSVDKFAIDLHTGVITTTQTLDHERQVKHTRNHPFIVIHPHEFAKPVVIGI